MVVKIQKLSQDAKVPTFAHPGDAGMDLYSISEIVIKPGQKQELALGFALAIPKGYAGLVWDKSGLANKHGIHCLAGVIDSGYRGEVKIVLINLGKKPYKFTKGDKVAQLLIQKVENVIMRITQKLASTSRADGGFGSTGKK